MPANTISNRNWDGRNHNKSKNAVHHIFLVRHGQYDMDESKYTPSSLTEDDFLFNDEYCILTDLGKEQASYAGKYLKRTLEKEGLSEFRLYSSDATRAIQTAEIINQDFPEAKHYKDSILREGYPCHREPFPIKPNPEEAFDESMRFLACARKFIHRPEVDLAERKRGVEIDGITHSTDILVCHGNLIRFLVAYALQINLEGWMNFYVGHASVSRISIDSEGKVEVKSVGCNGFLPIDKVTG
ncbi:Serine/threonine-protein phosphatase pgam5, mitochondrial [Terramyces sp. JEL0728]|nr:Serine/threonine-protein phosphatase pgam5, mitochondrial [Terramyces sp. JEL0728]